MRRYTPLFAALAAAFSVGTAGATTLLIDDFSLPNPVVTLQDCDPSAAQNANVGTCHSPSGLYQTSTALNSPPLIATSRSVGINLIQDTFGSGANLRVGQTVGGGVFDVSTGSGASATNAVFWTIPAGTYIPALSASSIFFNVLNNDHPGQVTVDFSYQIFNGVNFTTLWDLGPINIVSAPPTTAQSFGLTAPQSAIFDAGGFLVASFAGPQSYDLTLGSLGLLVPEPSSIALAGLALLGAGIASRRRRA